MREKLILLPYDEVSPRFASDPIYAGAGVAVLGRATIGRDAWFGTKAVIRADGNYVQIGDDFHLGAHGTVHIAHDIHPTHVGDGVTAGINSIIHACDVGNRCHIGRDVIILDGSILPDEVALQDGSIVFPRTKLESGWVYAGQPVSKLRKLEPGELNELHGRSRSLSDISKANLERPPELDPSGHLFVAATADLSGSIVTGAEVGIWFGCELEAGLHCIRIGENTNIQDNSIIRSVGHPVRIGREATIGHNVVMTDCEVADRSLIGMGAVVAPGTIVNEDVLLAAGAHTLAGQVLESGWLYGGNPARQLSRLDDRKRELIAQTWPTYKLYARKFAAAQEKAGSMTGKKTG